MTAKEYLSQVRHLGSLIDSRMRELDYWREMSMKISGSNFEPHYNPNNPTESKFARSIEKIDEIQRDINDRIVYLVSVREKINGAIDRLDNQDEQLVLRYRYLDNFTWEEIGNMMNLSERTIFRIHGHALSHFSVPN